jgi:malonyl-CoA O-methyltransferase
LPEVTRIYQNHTLDTARWERYTPRDDDMEYIPMTINSDVPAEDLDRIRFLVNNAFCIALYVRHHWASLPDRLYYLALLGNHLDVLNLTLPPELVQEIKNTVDPLEGLSVPKEVEVLEAYQNWASTYDQGFNPVIFVEEPHVQQLLGNLKGKYVADIGCGTGRHSRYAIQQGAAVVHGVDFSNAMLKVAQGHAAHLDNMFVAQGKIEALPLASGAYDVAVCALALEHVADFSSAIHELARLLKPGGTLVISDYHPTLIMIGHRSGLRNYVHYFQDYVTLLIEAGLHITAVREPKVSDLPESFPRLNTSFAKLLAHMPFVIIFQAQKQWLS